MRCLHSLVLKVLRVIGNVKVWCHFSFRILQGPDGHPRKVEVKDNGDGTHAVSYLPDDCGKYKVSVNYGGEVPQSPFPVQVQATGKVRRQFFFNKVGGGDLRENLSTN